MLTPPFDREIESILRFFTTISPSYYILLVVNVVLLYLIVTSSKRFKNAQMSPLLVLLLYAFTVDFPRLFFTNPFQTETFKQAKTFIVLKTGFFINGPEPDSIGDPMTFSIFTLVSGIPSFHAILWIIPTTLWILNALFMYVLIKERLGISPFNALVLSAIYVASTFELYFANRYSLATPVFILAFMTLLLLLRAAQFPNIISFMLLFTSLTFTHVMFALMILFVLMIVYLIYSTRTNAMKSKLGVILSIVTIIFILWYVVAYGSLSGLLKAIINTLRENLHGTEVPELLKGYTSTRLKTDYLYLIVARIFTAMSILVAPILLLLYLLAKRGIQYFIESLKRTAFITKALLIVYISLLIMIYIWVWGRFTGSLRPYQTLAPIIITLLGCLMIELLKTKELKRVFTLLKFLMVLLTLLSPFILWGPNVTYVNFPSRDITMIRFLGEYVPVGKEIGGVSIGYPEKWLLSQIYSTRSDIRLRAVTNIVASYHVDTNILRKCDAIVMNGRVLGLNSKYVYTPSLYERLLYVSLRIQEYEYQKVFDCGRFRWLYAH